MIASIQAAIDGGVNMVQIRQKDANYEELSEFTSMILKLEKNTTLIMVNSETPINIHGTAGTHFPEKTDSKTLYPWPQNKIYGQSVHSVISAKRAETNKINYVIAGTIFPSSSHPNGLISGTKLIRDISKEISIPVIGIGGITQYNAMQVIESGASGIAVISSISKYKDTYKASKSLADAIGI
tara:strand:- start:199 stop:747 length:549 start_codon:yes stop_codon:yes gene_type:complete